MPPNPGALTKALRAEKPALRSCVVPRSSSASIAGENGAPYLEETYYYRFQPEIGYGIQRNYRDEEGFDEFFAVHDRELTLVKRGYHPVVATPGSNMYFLNYQAGDLLDGARATPPYDDPAYVWIKNHWEEGVLHLPIGEK